MSFLNNVSQKLSQISQTTVQKTKDMTDTVQTKMSISDTEKEIHRLYNVLGQRYYELLGSCPAPELVDTCNAIHVLRQKFDSLQTEIEMIKATTYCPSCGAKITDDSAFCTNCGYDLLKRSSTNRSSPNTQKKRKVVISAVSVCIIVFIVAAIVCSRTEKKYENDIISFSEKETKKVKVGDVIKFGSYDLDNDESNGEEDIEWIVLDKDDDRILVLSKYIVGYDKFYNGYFTVTWEDSEIRYWLNEEFADDAFTLDEQERIVPTCHYVPGAMMGGSYYIDPTEVDDYLFLLSEEEVQQYLDGSKHLNCTRYGDKDNNVSWWLRSPGINHYCATIVLSTDDNYIVVYENEDDENKGPDFASSDVDNKHGIRPAMWITKKD